MRRRIRGSFVSVPLGALLLGCGSPTAAPSPPSAAPYNGGDAPHSRAAETVMLRIPAGRYVAGSTPEEREQAYLDYRNSAGRDDAQHGAWFDREEDRRMTSLPAFRIDQTPVTNAAYAEFVADTGRPPPAIDRAGWEAQGFVQRYDDEVERFVWRDGRPPEGRADHPVVLVTWDDAAAYCAWRGALVGEPRRLPSAAEYEKAARGEGGRLYPWGNSYDGDKLNDRVRGPGDTSAVGAYPDGASTYGMLDAAGNVFEWTSTPWPGDAAKATVKGSAWDDYAGVGRGAQRHGRAKSTRHAIIGFRCAAD